MFRLSERSLARLKANRDAVLERIEQAAARGGRPPGSCRLLAVVKGVPDEVALALTGLGQDELAENRVQPLMARDPALQQRARFHLIGHLQTNKARRAVRAAVAFHGLDSARLATLLDQEAGRAGISWPVYLQVNVAREEQKYGCDPDQAGDLARQVAGLQALRLQGLMAMAPFVDDPEETRPTFRALRDLSARLREDGALPADADGLSMGMSQDFEVAVEEGATLVRVGSALFTGVLG